MILFNRRPLGVSFSRISTVVATTLLFASLSACGGGGSGDDEQTNSSDLTDSTNVEVTFERNLVEGAFTISYPESFLINENINQIVPNSDGSGVLTFARNAFTAENLLSELLLCLGAWHFTELSREENVANGTGNPQLTLPISQQDVSVDGRSVVEYLFVDLVDDENPNDTAQLLALGHKYYFDSTENVFERNLVIDVNCFASEIGFSFMENEIREILGSVRIQ